MIRSREEPKYFAFFKQVDIIHKQLRKLVELVNGSTANYQESLIMFSEKLLPFAAALGPLNLTLAICMPLCCCQVPVFTSKKGKQNPFLHGKVMSSREAQVLEALRGKRTGEWTCPLPLHV
jgi:hypothetical protein